jgi:hypothetical protein
LWRAYQYQQDYIALLLGTLSKAEFMTRAEGYARPYDHTYTTEEIDQAKVILRDLLHRPITSTDLDILLNISHIEEEGKNV